MKNTASDLAGLPYDPLSMASLQLWKQENQEDNRPRIERLLRNLPLAMEEELTPRQRQIYSMIRAGDGTNSLYFFSMSFTARLTASPSTWLPSRSR